MFKTIRQRLLAMFVATSIVPLVGISIYNYFYFNSAWVSMNQVDLTYLNRQTTNELNHNFLKAADEVFSWQERHAWGDGLVGDRQTLSATADEVAHENHLIDALFVLDKDGRIVATNQEDKEGNVNPYKDTKGLFFPAYRDLSQEEVSISTWRDINMGAVTHTVLLSFPVFAVPPAAPAKKPIVMKAVHKAALVGKTAHAPRVAAAAAKLAEAEPEPDNSAGEPRYVGMVVGMLNQRQITAALEAEREELMKRSFGSGIVVVANRTTGQIYSSVHPAEQQMGNLELPRDAATGTLVNFAGTRWYAFVERASFGDNDLAIASLISEENLLQSTRVLLKVNAAVYGVVLLMLAFMVVMLTKALSDPVSALTKQADAFGAGDYHSAIAVASTDEIGRLAHVLEQTRQNVASYIVQLTAAKEEQERMAQSFARFVPVEFLQSLGKAKVSDIQIGDTVRKDITVFFSDIRGFTAISERMSAESLFRFLNSLFADITPPIHDFHGFIDKFIGDAIMALFTGSANDAVSASLGVRKCLSLFNSQTRNVHVGPIEIGIGLNTGSLMMGTVGSDERIDTTVIGDTVNLASRIESATKYYGAPLIISGSTFEALTNPGQFNTRDIDIVRVKGKQQPVRLYEVIDAESDAILEAKLGTLKTFNDSMQSFRERRFTEALKGFQSCLQACETDKIAQLYVARCAKYQADPPAADWIGVSTLTEK